MKKHIVIETLDSLEDEFDTERLIEKLLFIEKVEKGLKDVEEGKVIDYKEVKNKFFDKWNK
jgi:predicted transcriptional regulator